MEEIQNLFKKIITKFMENGFKMNWTINWVTANMTTETMKQTIAEPVTAAKL